MNEQRPPTSPGAHAAGQPQRLSPAPHAPHAPQPLRPPQAPHAPTLQPTTPRPAMRPPPAAPVQPARALPLQADDELVVLDDEPLELEDDAAVTAPAPVTAGAPSGAASAAKSSLAVDGTPSKKITFGAELQHRKRDWKRVPHNSGHGACRVKTFHAKLSDQGLEYLDDAINVFLDEHPDVDVKFVEQTIGMFDGKFKDFALIVSVWY